MAIPMRHLPNHSTPESFIGTDGSSPGDCMGDDGLALFLEQGDELFLLGHQGVDLGGFAVKKLQCCFVPQLDGIGKCTGAELFIADALAFS